MKTIKFKKWIITAIVSIIMTVIFAIIAVIVGGTSMLYGMGNMMSSDLTSYNIGVSYPDFLDGFSNCSSITITGDENGNQSVESNCQFSTGMMNNNNMMNSNIEDTAGQDLTTYFDGQIIETKNNLNAILDQISVYVTNNGYTTNKDLKEIADVSADYADNLIELNPIGDDYKNDEDQVDYFERTQLNNQDLENYIYLYLQDSL